MAQLAAMGVSVPDDHRGETPIAGGWQVVSQRLIEADEQTPNESSLSVGIRKRKFEGQEEEEEAGEAVAKRGWGSTTKVYPTNAKPDLEALLAGTIPVKTEVDVLVIKKEELDRPAIDDHICDDAEDKNDTSVVEDNVRPKQQEVSQLLTLPFQALDQPTDTTDNTTERPDFVFRKRKPKTSRQK